jgi:hypothetical protein
MKNHTSLKQFFALLIIFTSLAYFSCENKTDKANEPQDEGKTDGVTTDTISDGSEPKVQEPLEESKITIADLTGKWTGTFDKRPTIFTITEQTDSSFVGKISISYREVINQDVKGTFSPTTMKMSMTDQLHSRYQGKYNGTLSEDGNNFSGAFTMDLDGSKFSFNLNKK